LIELICIGWFFASASAICPWIIPRLRKVASGSVQAWLVCSNDWWTDGILEGW